jgi:hypothetical protein
MVHRLTRMSIRRSSVVTSDHIPPPFPSDRKGVYIEANFASDLDNSSYVRFVHACMGFPAPITFLNAVSCGFINGPNQFSRLTARMVRKHMPNTLATARGHLDKTTAKPPHLHSEAVSALQRFRTRQRNIDDRKKTRGSLKSDPFDFAHVPKSTTIHLDYTGILSLTAPACL